MVTIEQKLMLFENLIQHDIFEVFKNEKYRKEQYYNNKMIENKAKVDRISWEMKTEQKEKLDRIYVKEEAQIKKVYENSFLKTKEELLNKVVNKIEEKLEGYTRTNQYKQYIDITINQVCSEIDFDKDIILYMTEKDIQTYGSYILEKIRKNNIDKIEAGVININLDKARDSIIGGIIVKTVDESMRYDFSLRRNLEESMGIILKSLNAIIEEGDIV